MLLRKIADTTSAAPAKPNMMRAMVNESVNPNTAIETPQPMTAMTVARPWRRTDPTHPEVTAPTNAPTPGAA